MAPHVCPWWFGYWLASPIRQLWQRPGDIVGPYVAAGMTVLEPGPGMGFFSLELGRRVGPTGRVVAVDVQERMLRALRRRARRAGLLDRIDARLAGGAELPIEDLAACVDFVLAFAVVHEVPDPAAFFRAVARSMKPGARLLLAEPRGHVRVDAFRETLQRAADARLTIDGRPAIRGSHAAVLVRT